MGIRTSRSLNPQKTQITDQINEKEQVENSLEQNTNPRAYKSEHIEHIYIKIKEIAERKDIEKIVETKKYFQLLNNETWCFSQWEIQTDFTWFLNLVDSIIGVKTIKALSKGHQSSILKQMEEIKMPNLQKLCLQSCYLQSVEFLPNLQCPNLKQLYLNDNKITSIKPLRRLNCNLSIISVTLNHIPNLQENLPWMIYFNNEQIDLLSFEANTTWNQQNGHFVYGNSIDWIFKIPTETIIRVELQAIKRIAISNSKFKLIKRKYVGKNGIFLWGPNHTAL